MYLGQWQTPRRPCADDKIAEPHPLPLTRQWVEDYKRYGTGPKPVEGEQPKHVTIPLDENQQESPRSRETHVLSKRV